MSNLFKSGLVPFASSTKGEPFILDTNSRPVADTGRIIRPVEENEAAEEPEATNEEILTDAYDKAKLLVDDSRNQAAAILEKANEEAQAIREKAKQEGYEQGLEEGNMEAMKRADVYLEKLQRQQDELMQQNTLEVEKYVHETEDKLVELVCGLVKKLTGIVVDTYKPVLLHMINGALGEAETSKKFTIKVSEDNYRYVIDNVDRISGASNPSVTIEIFGDKKLTREQCIIETDYGIIDLSMDVQVQNLINAIKLLSE